MLWATLGEDENSLWNIVLADSGCNAYKSNKMPSEDLIKKLNIRNENLVNILENGGRMLEEHALGFTNLKTYKSYDEIPSAYIHYFEPYHK